MNASNTSSTALFSRRLFFDVQLHLTLCGLIGTSAALLLRVIGTKGCELSGCPLEGLLAMGQNPAVMMLFIKAGDVFEPRPICLIPIVVALLGFGGYRMRASLRYLEAKAETWGSWFLPIPFGGNCFLRRQSRGWRFFLLLMVLPMRFAVGGPVSIDNAGLIVGMDVYNGSSGGSAAYPEGERGGWSPAAITGILVAAVGLPFVISVAFCTPCFKPRCCGRRQGRHHHHRRRDHPQGVAQPARNIGGTVYCQQAPPLDQPAQSPIVGAGSDAVRVAYPARAVVRNDRSTDGATIDRLHQDPLTNTVADSNDSLGQAGRGSSSVSTPSSSYSSSPTGISVVESAAIPGRAHDLQSVGAQFHGGNNEQCAFSPVDAEDDIELVGTATSAQVAPPTSGEMFHSGMDGDQVAQIDALIERVNAVRASCGLDPAVVRATTSLSGCTAAVTWDAEETGSGAPLLARPQDLSSNASRALAEPMDLAALLVDPASTTDTGGAILGGEELQHDTVSEVLMTGDATPASGLRNQPQTAMDRKAGPGSPLAKSKTI